MTNNDVTLADPETTWIEDNTNRAHWFTEMFTAARTKCQSINGWRAAVNNTAHCY